MFWFAPALFCSKTIAVPIGRGYGVVFSGKLGIPTRLLHFGATLPLAHTARQQHWSVLDCRHEGPGLLGPVLELNKPQVIEKRGTARESGSCVQWSHLGRLNVPSGPCDQAKGSKPPRLCLHGDSDGQ